MGPNYKRIYPVVIEEGENIDELQML